jgi:hypothetical protein
VIAMAAEPQIHPVRGNDGWRCSWCDDVVCPACWVVHGIRKHPERYTAKASNDEASIRAGS